ncbi:unnamed protein product [Brachionus calyciflorus]|uniref:Syntaxin N-terminal domain-containing protein n=1 Tax=Brachionus calyciflorus TaxID=104777 RepID=A0A813RQ42_9BILA|nr:unnamed protein product [Brachionus calyciflorus]
MQTNSELDFTIQNLNSNIQILETHLTQIEYLGNQIGKENDSLQLRDELLDWQQRAKQIVSKAQLNFETLKKLPNTSEIKAQKDRIADELIENVRKFQSLVKQTLRKERENYLEQPTSSSLVSNFLFQNNSTTKEENLNNLNILEVNLEEIKQVRDQESQLYQMEADVNYLNIAIRDIAILVQDQHEVLEKIEVKIEQNVPQVVPKPFIYNPIVDPVVQELKEKVAFVVALVILFTIFSLILLALFI